MSLQNFRPLAFGEILDGAFSLYRRNFGTFALTAVLPVAAITIAFAMAGGASAMAVAGGDFTAAAAGTMGAFGLAMLVTAVASCVMWAGLTHEASEAYHGRPVTVGDGVQAGLRAFLPLVGAGIVFFIAFMIGAFAVAMVAGILMAILGPVIGGVLMVGLIVAYYLGVFALMFAVVPAVVVERKGPIDALARSIELAKGAIGRVIGAMFVILIISYLPVLAITMGGVMMMGGGAAAAEPSLAATLVQSVLTMLASILTTPFMVAAVVLLYFDRRVRTEALDVQMAADSLGVAGA